MRKFARARQLPAKSLGVLPWQQDFWLFLIEHVRAKKSGPPVLSALEGFSAPAITQYTVTTPDLLRSFRKYNDGKPYHRQVRPFGFMVMLQQADEADQSTTMRVIAPFNRNPAKAARKAFDRDTGATIKPKQLRTYAHSLEHYHNHPEAKFLNGERGDRGPTIRRHVIARSIVHIGKEANRLDIQSASGVDPEAQVEFSAISASRTGRFKAIRAALKKLGPSRLAREADLSRQYLFKLAGGGVAVTEAALAKVEQAVASLEVVEARNRGEADEMRAWLRDECERISVRQAARNLGINPGHLSRIMAHARRIPASLVQAINKRRSQATDKADVL